MATLDDLKKEWYEIVATNEEEARIAWLWVDVVDTDMEGTCEYYSELINTFKRIRG